MRKILICLFVPLLSGCGTVQQAWESYWLPPFDNREYAYAVELRTMSEFMSAQCQDAKISAENATVIHRKAQEFYNYARELQNNRDVAAMANSIKELTVTLPERYSKAEPVSVSYCRSKYNLITLASTGAQQAMARKKR
jgi:hypothetical protein